MHRLKASWFYRTTIESRVLRTYSNVKVLNALYSTMIYHTYRIIYSFIS